LDIKKGLSENYEKTRMEGVRENKWFESIDEIQIITFYQAKKKRHFRGGK